MSKNINQVFVGSPITTNDPNDLMYFGRSPYGLTDDKAMKYSDFSEQFITNTPNSVSFDNLPLIADDHLLGNDAGVTGIPGSIAVGAGLNLASSTLTVAASGLGFPFSGTDTGIRNAPIATLPGVTTPFTGLLYLAKVFFTNDNIVNTIQVNATTVNSLNYPNGLSLMAGDIGGNYNQLFYKDVSNITKLVIPGFVYNLPTILANEQFNLLTDTGTANNYAGTLKVTASSTGGAGFKIVFVPLFTNIAGASTIAFTPFGSGSAITYSIKNQDGTDPSAGQIKAGNIHILQKASGSGTIMNLINPAFYNVNAGGTGVTSVTTSPTASSFAGWDANRNMSANNFIQGYATTATAGTTTTLTAGSAEQQYFTGTTTQTIVMPVTSTLVVGQQFEIFNQSTGILTVNASGGISIKLMAANTSLLLTCISTAITTPAGWSQLYLPLTFTAASVAVLVGSTGTNSAYGGDGTANSFTLGNYSFSYGDTNTKATGLNSLAFGHTCTASDQFAVAIGTGCTASSRYCLAFGRSATAANFDSFAFGNGATANGAGSFAFGNAAAGSGPVASNDGCVAFGSKCRAVALNSWALGNSSQTTNAGAVVWSDPSGVFTSDSANNQFVWNFSGGYVFYKSALSVASVGFGLQVKEGSNAKQGVVTLAAGIGVVANTAITANSRIFCFPQDTNTTGFLTITARTTGSGFTVTSSVLTDTGVVAYQIFEPA